MESHTLLCTTPPWTRDGNNVVLIGWEDVDDSAQRGPIDPAFVDRLADLLATTEGFLGVLCVDNCAQCDAPILEPIYHNNKKIPISTGRLVVPAADRCYVTPAMILHSIMVHGYVPPQEFCEAVMHCPPRRTPEYRASVQRFWPSPIHWV